MASLYSETFFDYINYYLGWYRSVNIPYDSLIFITQLLLFVAFTYET